MSTSTLAPSGLWVWHSERSTEFIGTPSQGEDGTALQQKPARQQQQEIRDMADIGGRICSLEQRSLSVFSWDDEASFVDAMAALDECTVSPLPGAVSPLRTAGRLTPATCAPRHAKTARANVRALHNVMLCEVDDALATLASDASSPLPCATATPLPPLLPPGVHAAPPPRAPGATSSLPCATAAPLSPGVHAYASSMPLAFDASLPLPCATATPLPPLLPPGVLAAGLPLAFDAASPLRLPFASQAAQRAREEAQKRARKVRAKAKERRDVTLDEVDHLGTAILDQVAKRLKVSRKRVEGRRGYCEIRADVKSDWPAGGVVTIGEYDGTDGFIM